MMTCDSVSLTNPRFNKEMYHMIAERVSWQSLGPESDHSSILSSYSWQTTTKKFIMSPQIIRTQSSDIQKQTMKETIYQQKITFKYSNIFLPFNLLYLAPKVYGMCSVDIFIFNLNSSSQALENVLFQKGN